MNSDARTRTKVRRIHEKVGRMIREQTEWTGKRPEVIRLPMSEYLLMTEAGKGNVDGIELRPAPHG